MKYAILAFCTMGILAAQDGHQPTSVALTVTKDQQITFLKAQLDNARAMLQACQAPEKLKNAVNEIQDKACPLVLGPDGLLACAPPPTGAAVAPIVPQGVQTVTGH